MNMPHSISPIEEILKSEFSELFVEYMKNAMAVSFFKYGRVADAFPDNVDAIKSLSLRLEKYQATGNSEFLVDIANFAMIEFMRPRHARAFYQATDSRESPGRSWVAEDGELSEVSQRANDGSISVDCYSVRR